MVSSKILENDSLEIYISFDRLKASDLAFCLDRFSLIGEKIAEDFYVRSGAFAFNDDFPVLEIESAHTGDSIKVKLIEGWKPTVTVNNEGEWVVKTSKKLGIPLLVGWLIITNAVGFQDFQNKSLDNELKRIEIQLKQMELDEKIANKKELLQPNTISNRIPELQPLVSDTTKKIIMNDDFKNFRINGVDIKKLPDADNLITEKNLEE